MEKKIWDIIILGGGASGVFAAINAKTEKNTILVLEKTKDICKKILISGNGKCNFSNSIMGSSSFFPQNIDFTEKILNNFSNTDLIHSFNKIGLLEKEERFGRIIPVTNEALSVKTILKRELMHKNVDLETEVRIKSIKRKDEVFELTSDNNIYYCHDLIISTGGYSYPSTGTTGDGYRFAENFGHSINHSQPVLVPLELENNPFARIQGIKMDVILKNSQFEREGEILFTKYGISGPAALDISLPFIAAHKKDRILNINFLSSHTFLENDLLVERFRNSRSCFNLRDFFSGLLPEKFINRILSVLVSDSNLRLEEKLKNIDEYKFIDIIQRLKNYKCIIKSTKDFDQARTDFGGIPHSEINPENCESKIQPNLFFTGEMINITGLSGGYNLHFAFSTGFSAGNYLKGKTMEN